jgi:hypothetical protein
MTQQIIDVGANANDGTGEPLREAFTAVNDNFTEIYTAGPVGTNVKISGNIITTTVTNLGLTLAGNGIGNIQANSTVVPGTSGVYDLGAPERTFQYIYGDYLVGNGALITGISAGSSITNGNSNVRVSANSNVTVGVSGVSNVAVFATTGEYVTGVVSASGNIVGANVLTSGIVSATGNIAGNYVIGNGSLLTGVTATSAGFPIVAGTSNISAVASGNISISSNGVSNVMVVSSQDVSITGNLSVTGNATLSGNILGDRIQNGNTSIDIQTVGGNANISVGGVSNVAVFAPTGEYVTGVVSATGNVTGGNVITGGLISATANITGGNVLTSGVVSATGNVTGNYFVGNGTALTGVLADRGNDTNNWDSLTQMGVYLVNRTSWSGTQGTPLDSQIFVGLLQVQTSQNQATTQVFYPGQVNAADVKIQWDRSLWNGSWTSWIKMTNDGQQISGGEF